MPSVEKLAKATASPFSMRGKTTFEMFPISRDLGLDPIGHRSRFPADEPNVVAETEDLLARFLHVQLVVGDHWPLPWDRSSESLEKVSFSSRPRHNLFNASWPECQGQIDLLFKNQNRTR
jgi:hypothetical protein